MISALEVRARQALAELLGEWELYWLQWPSFAAAPKLAPHAPEGWFHLQTERPRDWAQQVQVFQHCQCDPAQPLLVVLEVPGDLDRLRALLELATPIPWLLILLLDPGGWFCPVPSGGGWFGRNAEPPAYAWPAWLRSAEVEFFGSLSLEEPRAIADRFDLFMNGQARRLLHLHGPEMRVETPVLAPRALVSAADSLESAFLSQVPGLLNDSARLIWASRAAHPPDWKCLRVEPAQACAAAWGVCQAGLIPVVVLSAGELAGALAGLVEGVPPHCALLILETGLCYEPEQSHLSPSRLRDLALLRQVHGLALTCPADVEEAAQLLKMSFETMTPIALRLSQAPAVLASLGSVQAQAGRGHCLRQGQHAAILCLGPTVYPALLAAESLASWGLECQVWDVRFLKPLDREMLEQAAEGGHILTVEEHCLQGGLATMTLETLSLLELTPKVHHLALPATPPITRGGAPEEFGLDADGIQRAMRKLLGLAAPVL